MRVQYEIDDDLIRRIGRYEEIRYRSNFAKTALIESLNRREARDKRAVEARIEHLEGEIRPLMVKIIREELKALGLAH